MVREIPILFSAPMVLAIGAGRKTVTRRIVKPQPEPNAYGTFSWPSNLARSMVETREMGCLGPYGSRGDRLWVKETWRPRAADGGGLVPDSGDVAVTYAADNAELFFPESKVPQTWTMPKAASRPGWVTPLFMPRWASRFLLGVISVRVERLHEITEEDAALEGVGRHTCGSLKFSHVGCCGHRRAFEALWGDINGASSWAANPFVWRIEFRRLP